MEESQRNHYNEKAFSSRYARPRKVEHSYVEKSVESHDSIPQTSTGSGLFNNIVEFVGGLFESSSSKTTQNTNSYYNHHDTSCAGYHVDEIDALRGKGNEERPEYDLGKDGAFNDFSVLVGSFYSEIVDSWNTNAGAALKQKGFRVDFVTQEQEFIELLQKKTHDVAWIISSQTCYVDLTNFKKVVLDFHRSGRGLFIFGDNEPWFAHANIVLPDMVGTKLIGNTPGGRVLSYGNALTSGEFDENSLIFAGINYLFEGITICYPAGEGKLKHLATSSNGKPLISFMDSTETCGRVIVDSGFTKLYCSWTSAGQARYIVNATVYLVDVERRFKTPK